jgi:polyketide cyclase/dehydrase/lipid transport protein
MTAHEHELIDRDRFALDPEATEAWDDLDARPARELSGLRRLMERPTPFDREPPRRSTWRSSSASTRPDRAGRRASTALSYDPRMDLGTYRHRTTITIDRPAEEIYDLLADVSRMARWSPVCTGGHYDDDSREWFTGTNAVGSITWETRCRVVAAERGREFTFVNHGASGNHPMVRWGFLLEPVSPRSIKVTQTWEVLPGYADGFAEEEDPGMTLVQRLDLMKGFAESGMPETLAALKQDAESIESATP